MYLMRLDDAAEFMDLEKWKRAEAIFDKYGICPIFGIIPNCKDEGFCEQYEKNEAVWDMFHSWIEKGWTPALHGYEHVYCTKDAGINPYVKGSEFAGLSYDEQKEKITKGMEILKSHGIEPKIFFAPSHTFDENTLSAIKDSTDIRIISDTIATDIYYSGDFYFIPMISSNARPVSVPLTTFCYHPNTMSDEGFDALESFIKEHKDEFVRFDESLLRKRKLSFKDKAIRTAYFTVRRFRKIK